MDESSSKVREGLGHDVEREVWSVVDALPVEEILKSLPPRSVRNIPPCLRLMFQECCNIPLRKIEEDPSSDSGWKLLFLFPRILLQPHERSGKVGNRELKARYQRFLSFHWKDSLKNNWKCQLKKSTIGW